VSYIGSNTRRLFGGKPDTANGSAPDIRNLNTVNQLQAESITATCARMMRGPRANGHMSAHIIVGAGSSPVGTLTVGYSNLPDPDPANDAHWVPDANVSSVDLSVVANTFLNLGNIDAEYARFKVTYTSGTISLIVFVRAEGLEPR
jgi:hypothetical protein